MLTVRSNIETQSAVAAVQWPGRRVRPDELPQLRQQLQLRRSVQRARQGQSLLQNYADYFAGTCIQIQSMYVIKFQTLGSIQNKNPGESSDEYDLR